MEVNIISVGIFVVGVLLIAISVWLNSVKRLAVNYAVIWGIAGVLMVLMGAIPFFSSWTRLLAPGTGLALFCVGILVVFTELQNSLVISQLNVKNRELAMQVALLNQESERIMAMLEELEKVQEDAYEEDTVHG